MLCQFFCSFIYLTLWEPYGYKLLWFWHSLPWLLRSMNILIMYLDVLLMLFPSYLFNFSKLQRLSQILKDDAVNVLHSICQKIWKTQQWPQDCKRSVFIPIPKKGNAKECSNYHTIAHISHASKVMLKILQARLQKYVNHEFQMFKLNLEKGEEPEIQLSTFVGSLKKHENSWKKYISDLLTTSKPWTVWIITNCGKFFKIWEHQTTWPVSWDICMQVRKQQLELDMEQ